MSTYVVKALHVSGVNKKMHDAGDIVTDKDFPEGIAEQLLKSEHLRKPNKEEQAEAVKLLKSQKAEAKKIQDARDKENADSIAKDEDRAEAKEKADAEAKEEAEAKEKADAEAKAKSGSKDK